MVYVYTEMCIWEGTKQIPATVKLAHSVPLSHVGIILRLGEMCTMCEKYPVCTVCTGSQRYTIQWYVQGHGPPLGIMNEVQSGSSCAFAHCPA